MIASPGYLESNAMPRTCDDLASHTLLELESPVAPPDEWLVASGK
jgi:hypothetical protein